MSEYLDENGNIIERSNRRAPTVKDARSNEEKRKCRNKIEDIKAKMEIDELVGEL